jgi:hypothetical protein
MIRRGFWLAAGAVTGIYGYRRVSAIGRRLSASEAISVRQARRGALRLARETYRFTRDVQEGMEIYRLAHPQPAGSTLSTDRSTDRSTDHDVQPEDGH